MVERLIESRIWVIIKMAQSDDEKTLQFLGLYCNNANGGGVALCIFFSELNKWPRLLSLGYNKKEEQYYVYVHIP